MIKYYDSKKEMLDEMDDLWGEFSIEELNKIEDRIKNYERWVIFLLSKFYFLRHD